MNLVEELTYLCTYVLAVADAPLPAQVRYDLIFHDEVAEKVDRIIPCLDVVYGTEEEADWEGYEEEVQEYAAVIARLLADLEKVG